MSNGNVVFPDARSTRKPGICPTVTGAAPASNRSSFFASLWRRPLKELPTLCDTSSNVSPSLSISFSGGEGSSCNGDSSWNAQHPSAIHMLNQMTSEWKHKQIVMFLDYDGTLSPIVNDPDRAFMSEAMRNVVREVAMHMPTAIVSGRSTEKVYSFVQLPELYYAGSHGMDIVGPSKSVHCKNGKKSVLCQPANDFLPLMDEVYRILVEKTKSVPGARVENNKFCLSVHFRCVDEKRAASLADHVTSVVAAYPNLRLTPGLQVLEVRPNIQWDKGKAVGFLLQSLGFSRSKDVLPVYIGDDRTDEDAFKALLEMGQGVGILVSRFPKETYASYCLNDPSEVMEFLKCLVEWKRRRG